MINKFNQFLNIMIGSFIGVLIGYSLFKYIDYTNNRDLYALQSTPWYTSIFIYGGVTLFVVVVSLILKFVIRKKLKAYVELNSIKK